MGDYQARPDRAVIAGAVNFADLAGCSRVRDNQPADENVIPGEQSDGLAHTLSGPVIAHLLEVLPYTLAVKITGHHHRTGCGRGVRQDGVDLVFWLVLRGPVL